MDAAGAAHHVPGHQDLVHGLGADVALGRDAGRGHAHGAVGDFAQDAAPGATGRGGVLGSVGGDHAQFHHVAHIGTHLVEREEQTAEAGRGDFQHIGLFDEVFHFEGQTELARDLLALVDAGGAGRHDVGAVLKVVGGIAVGGQRGLGLFDLQRQVDEHTHRGAACLGDLHTPDFKTLSLDQGRGQTGDGFLEAVFAHVPSWASARSQVQKKGGLLRPPRCERMFCIRMMRQ